MPRKLYWSHGWSRSSFHWWTLTPTLHRLYGFLHAIWPDAFAPISWSNERISKSENTASKEYICRTNAVYLYLYKNVRTKSRFLQHCSRELMAVGWDKSALTAVFKMVFHCFVALPRIRHSRILGTLIVGTTESGDAYSFSFFFACQMQLFSIQSLWCMYPVCEKMKSLAAKKRKKHVSDKLKCFLPSKQILNIPTRVNSILLRLPVERREDATTYNMFGTKNTR